MNHARGGYTIVETMIVLSISMVILISAILLVQDQQGKAQFSDSVRDIQSKVVDWSNDVSTGFYPNSTSGYKCAIDIATGLAAVSNGPADLGTNEACIYVGKVIQFRPDSGDISVYTVFGKRTLPDGTLVSSLSEAKPVIAYKAGGPDLTENYSLLWKTQVQAMPSTPISGPSTTPTYTLAFYHALGTPPDGGSGASSSYMYNLAGNKLFATTDDINKCVQAASGSGCTLPTTALNKAQICFARGKTKHQFALLTISPSGDSINTQLDYVASCS